MNDNDKKVFTFMFFELIVGFLPIIIGIVRDVEFIQFSIMIVCSIALCVIGAVIYIDSLKQ